MDRGDESLGKELVKSGVIPVLVAVVVAVVGVALNQYVEHRKKSTDAENTARVVERNLWAAEDSLSRSYSDRRFRFYSLEVNIPLDDEKLLADKLDDGYEQVAAAAAAYSLEVARAREKHAFVQDDVVQLTCAMEKVARGRQALSELTDISEKSVRRDVRTSRRACRGEMVRDVAQLFYDNCVDGNRAAVDDHLRGEAVKMVQRKSPSCREGVRRTEHEADFHPYALATFNGDDIDGGSERVNVTLRTPAGRTVAKLVMADPMKDNHWQIEQIRGLKLVSIPGARGKEEKKKGPQRPSQS